MAILGTLASWITGGLVKEAGTAVTEVTKTIWGDKAARDAQVSQESRDIIAEFAAEFVARQQRTWWDSFVDGLNRLPRPLMALGALASIVWAPVDPVGFTECMTALATVPEQLWGIWVDDLQLLLRRPHPRRRPEEVEGRSAGDRAGQGDRQGT